MEQLKGETDRTRKKKAAEGEREVVEPYGAESETTQSRNVGNQVPSDIQSHHRRAGA